MSAKQSEQDYNSHFEISIPMEKVPEFYAFMGRVAGQFTPIEFEEHNNLTLTGEELNKYNPELVTLTKQDDIVGLVPTVTWDTLELYGTIKDQIPTTVKIPFSMVRPNLILDSSEAKDPTHEYLSIGDNPKFRGYIGLRADRLATLVSDLKSKNVKIAGIGDGTVTLLDELAKDILFRED